MEGVKTMKRDAYVIPNMGALKGRMGREIVEIIKNTPTPDRTALNAEAEKIKLRILAAKRNGK